MVSKLMGKQKSKRTSAKRFFLLLRMICAFFLFLSLGPFTFAQTNEYELKAVFLYNFTQFVSWPESAFSAPDMPFQLCLAGEDPFGHFLDEAVTSERVGRHQIVVRRIHDVENTASCHMIFVPEKNLSTLDEILSIVKGSPVLVVADEGDSAEKGATIGFLVMNRRIRLRVNLRSARLANLTISSKLLKLSDVIEEN
jgi:hypothetical protein